MPTPQTERLGVSALDHFFSEQGWLFREQSTHDYGIDAHIEIVENERPTGKLIALQIKSGTSFFKEETADSYVFRTDDKHVAYWVGHSMPVVLVLYNPDTKTAHWQQITRKLVKNTGKKWKIKVPKIDMLANPEYTLKGLKSLTQLEPYVRRLNRLRIDRHWMDLISKGVQVRITFEDWVNKSLPRYQVTIYTDDETETWPTLYAPGVRLKGMLHHFFPWAKYKVDEDAYQAEAEDRREAERYSYHDPETGKTYYSQDFDEWIKPPQGLVPVSENGETTNYVLILSLNKFGRSFMLLDDYLSDPEAPETIGFTLE
ncbi:DUF4365 domain-containing protein [Oxalicibacterium faecigallinarum]|uniref:DUF4365 domain-containing protein n=1 Tax=Oxalicibacterium faecigallinarum TaxID=573741 RepID=A0A8J3AZD0_9BURK|nr:DUF4365 domain-containing protein [Oxalicibacterium faecigallinarum]GGI20454.1 hypothetical protein GCM10008066_24110 [Oxalicibacterium faecigallinarum]